MEPLVFVLVTTGHADDRRDDAQTLFGGASVAVSPHHRHP